MDQHLSGSPDSVNLLWTGGWDSTFQLLQLLIVHRRRVTPFYLMDANRLSTGVEIRTIKRIKDRLLGKYPHTRDLLPPTQYFAVADVSPDAEIEKAFQSVLEKQFLSRQYDWLPRFCKENEFTDIQLCVHREDKAHAVIEQIVSESTNDAQVIFRADPKYFDTNEYVLFRYFSFPILKLTKIQMTAIAKKTGLGRDYGHDLVLP